MSIHDKTLIFYLNKEIEGTAGQSGTIASKAIDFRFDGGLEDRLCIRAYNTAGSSSGLSFDLETSEDGEDWDSAKQWTGEIAERLPANLQRFVRLECTGPVGAVIFAELTDTVDREIKGVRLQTESTRDVAAEGDEVDAANPPPEE